MISKISNILSLFKSAINISEDENANAPTSAFWQVSKVGDKSLKHKFSNKVGLNKSMKVNASSVLSNNVFNEQTVFY